MIVFDNVLHPEIISKYISNNSKGHILITSRYNPIQNSNSDDQNVKIGSFERKTSIQYLKRVSILHIHIIII